MNMRSYEYDHEDDKKMAEMAIHKQQQVTSQSSSDFRQALAGHMSRHVTFPFTMPPHTRGPWVSTMDPHHPQAAA